MRKKAETFVSFNAIIKSINRKTGKVTKMTKVHNTVVNDGLNWIRDLMGGAVSDNLEYIAIGTNPTAVQITDTELGSEIQRAAGTITYPENYKVRVSKTFTVGSGESYTVREAGIFDQAGLTGSTMFNRLVFDAYTLDSDNPLEIIITLTVDRV